MRIRTAWIDQGDFSAQKYPLDRRFQSPFSTNDNRTMPASFTSLLAALESREDLFQPVPEATPPPFLFNSHDEYLAHRHWVTRSASKAPAEAKLRSPWEHPQSFTTTSSFFEMTSSSTCTVASIVETASSDSSSQRNSHLSAPPPGAALCEGSSTNECEVSKAREKENEREKARARERERGRGSE